MTTLEFAFIDSLLRDRGNREYVYFQSDSVSCVVDVNLVPLRRGGARSL
jgi:hypothetical protein